MDERSVGGENYFNSKVIVDKLEEFRKELLDKLGEKSSAVSAKGNNY